MMFMVKSCCVSRYSRFRRCISLGKSQDLVGCMSNLIYLLFVSSAPLQYLDSEPFYRPEAIYYETFLYI